MAHKGLREPHVLLASSNPMKLIRNLSEIFSPGELEKIEKEISSQCRLLFELGQSHFEFARSLSTQNQNWRQKISRYYYAAYNCKRAVVLRWDGRFSTDSSDHQKVDELPTDFKNLATYRHQLKNLRDDRNLADYSHQATVDNLILTLAEAEALVASFVADCREFLVERRVYEH